MGTRRRPRRFTITAAGALLLLLTACASPAGGGTSAPAADEAPTAVPDEPETSATPAPRWPTGADAGTPECQDASAAVLAAANSAIAAASTGDARVAPLPWLSAHADPDLGAWTLTGITSYAPTAEGEGFSVVLASRDDPTAEDFSGELFSVGGSAASATGLPPLQPGYAPVDPMDDVPGSALGCAEMRPTQP